MPSLTRASAMARPRTRARGGAYDREQKPAYGGRGQGAAGRAARRRRQGRLRRRPLRDRTRRGVRPPHAHALGRRLEAPPQEQTRRHRRRLDSLHDPRGAHGGPLGAPVARQPDGHRLDAVGRALQAAAQPRAPLRHRRHRPRPARPRHLRRARLAHRRRHRNRHLHGDWPRDGCARRVLRRHLGRDHHAPGGHVPRDPVHAVRHRDARRHRPGHPERVHRHRHSRLAEHRARLPLCDPLRQGERLRRRRARHGRQRLPYRRAPHLPQLGGLHRGLRHDERRRRHPHRERPLVPGYGRHPADPLVGHHDPGRPDVPRHPAVAHDHARHRDSHHGARLHPPR